jgi:hypothetical protein
LGSQSAMALPPATADYPAVAGWGGYELCEWLFPHLRGLYVEQVQPAGEGVVMQARSRAAGANTRDFRCLWSSGVLPLWCSVPVFESGFVVPPLERAHVFVPRVAAGMARGSTVRGPGGRGGFPP